MTNNGQKTIRCHSYPRKLKPILTKGKQEEGKKQHRVTEEDIA
jgi:hypothetical protein